MSLALGDHADIEASVQELGGRELAKGQDRSVEVEVVPTGSTRPSSALCGCDGETRPSCAAAQLFANVPERHAPFG
jgi:hypothetical protein